MTIFERQKKILEYLEKAHFATIKELSNLVWTSESSIRRDLRALESKGYLKQIYGGVVFGEYDKAVVPIVIRDNFHSSVKDDLAKRAAELIFDGATVFLDGSSTVRRILRHISGSLTVRVITNNLNILNEHVPDKVTVYCTGGRFLPESNILVGSATEAYLNTVSADLLFFSSQAISEDGEISDVSEEETSLRRVMLSRAKQKIFLCDSSKIGIKNTFTVCTKDDVDRIICDVPLPWEK